MTAMPQVRHHFLIYDPGTGRIIGANSCGPVHWDVNRSRTDVGTLETDIDHAPNQTLSAEWYISHGKMKRRPVMGIPPGDRTMRADGQDLVTLKRLPIKRCAVRIEGPLAHDLIVEDGVFEFTTTAPGRFRIRIEAWPYQTREIVIDAN